MREGMREGEYEEERKRGREGEKVILMHLMQSVFNTYTTCSATSWPIIIHMYI